METRLRSQRSVASKQPIHQTQHIVRNPKLWLAIHEPLTDDRSPGAKKSRHPNESDNIVIHDSDDTNVSLALGAHHDQEVAPDIEQDDGAKDKEGPDANGAYDRVENEWKKNPSQINIQPDRP